MTSLRLLLTAVAATLASALPTASAQAAPPAVPRAEAAIVVDARDGDVIFQKNPDERRQIASTTKLMTALLTLERTRPGDVFRAAPYSASSVESKINLRVGERMTAEDLLEGLLLESANDAAVTLAVGISGSRSRFVREMNERAAELGLGDTSYANPIGFDDPGNHSTARELARLAARLMRNPRFARIVDMPSAVLESGARRRTVRNRNRLVARFGFVDGIKTGHTRGAGYVLVGAASGRAGARVVSVVMGEPGEAARDADTLELLRYGLSRFRRVSAVARARPLARVKIEHRDERAKLVPARDVSLTIHSGERVGRRLDAPEEVEGPLPAGARVGTVTVTLDGEPVRRVPLVTASKVPGAGVVRVVLGTLAVPLTFLAVAAMLIVGALMTRRRRPTNAT